MTRARAPMPSGHGELVTEPALDCWADLARRNAATAEAWEFEVAGVPVRDVRVRARRELLETGAATTARMGLKAAPPGPGPIIVTGHQPDLYHAGVWVKDFLVQRIAQETSGTGVDVVVDTDAFDWVGMTAPCLDPGVSRCRQYLAIGGSDSCYACVPVPSPEHLEEFCVSAAAVLESLPAPAIRRHFASFCDALRAAAPVSRSVAELVTGARRRFEGQITDYLELPVTAAAQTEAFRRFAVDILLGAERFGLAHNAELTAYRTLNGIRSAAQPVPDLEIGRSRTEVPFWLLSKTGRVAAYTRRSADGVELHGTNGPVVALPHDSDGALAALAASGVVLVPRAITLTLFMRTFLADLFIHGIGGGRYDRITDALAERWWGVSLPPFAVASLTMYLPLGAVAVGDEDLAGIDRHLHRLAHNPDELLGEVVFDSIAEQRSAIALAEEKRALVAAISEPGSDRKELGSRIRAVNDRLSRVVEPLVEELTRRRETLERQRHDAEVLTDRTYPFCLWSPAEVADKVL